MTPPAFRFPQALFWVDFETTNLPDGNDFSNVHVLEVAVIITDFDLQPYVGYEEVLKLTREGVDAIKANPVVLEMHKVNGLLKESRDASMSLA